MNRPENSTLITTKILKKIDGTFEVLVRRLIFANGNLITRSTLTRDGRWVNAPEGLDYKKECWLVSPVMDEGEIVKADREWLYWVEETRENENWISDEHVLTLDGTFFTE